MFEGFPTGFEEAAPDLHLAAVFAFKAFFQVVEEVPRLDGLAAGEDVHRRVAIFRPGVDGHVGLRRSPPRR